MPKVRLRVLGAVVALATLLAVGGLGSVDAAAPPPATPTPKAKCGPGSRPETQTQGRVPNAEVASGRAAKGYTCNAEVVGHYGSTGGFKVFRYVDRAGHECAIYDSTLLFPTTALRSPGELPGVFVLDMSDPAHPVRTATLVTPAMLSPHESLSLNAKRGLLAADMGYPTFNPGFVDIYDLGDDCRQPVLKSSTPLAILGHEGGISPDGNTFYASSAGGNTLTAIDITNPVVPVLLWSTTRYSVHGLNVSDDGNRLYFADLAYPGLTILDTSQIQNRVVNPQVPEVSRLTWPEVSIPQVPIPVRIKGHPYLVEIDEYARGLGSDDPAQPVGAARIIDIANEKRPRVISNIRLEVHQPSKRAGDQRFDTGAASIVQGYAGHYCSVPRRVDPGVVACSFIMSGMRLFDISDPKRPREIAYANFPRGPTSAGDAPSAFVMSAPAFAPERNEVWFTDGNSGFYNVRITNGVWRGNRRGTASPGRSTGGVTTCSASESRGEPGSEPFSKSCSPISASRR